jgi:hypothetical protein
MKNKDCHNGKKCFISKLMDAARQYTVWDFGMLKIALLFAGILLGTYFSNFFCQYINAIWIIAIAAYVFIIWSTIKKLCCKKKK